MISKARPIPPVENRLFLDQSRELLQSLAVLIRNSYLHDLGNDVFEEPLDRFQRSLHRLLSSEGEFRLERAGQELFANGVRIRMEFQSLQAYKFVIRELEARAAGGIAFERPEDRRATIALLECLVSSRENGKEADDASSLDEQLRRRGVETIELLPPRSEAEGELQGVKAPDRRERAINAYQQALDFIRESMAKLDSPAQVNLRRAKRTVQKLVDLSYEEGDGFSLAGLAAIKSHHDYTFNHMVNVSVLAIAFGQRLGLRRQDLAELGLCALYHDMGKLHIPLQVLDSKTDLDEKNWAIMGNHTIYAARTLFPLIREDPTTVNRILTALQHHLRFDGSGYPKLQIRKKQSLYARITSIVDTFDAMTTKRLYQRQYLPDEAIAILTRGAGRRYDPLLVKAFVNCMGIYPIGSTVLLRTGELAVVLESNPDPDYLHRPRIKRIANADYQPVSPTILDLSRPELESQSILRCVDPEAYGINSPHYVP